MYGEDYQVVGLVLLAVVGLALILAAWRGTAARLAVPPAWKKYRFGFIIYALIFLAFDMEMIFMYPWAVVFAVVGIKAFLDMLVFIGLLTAGVLYVWGMGGLMWE